MNEENLPLLELRDLTVVRHSAAGAVIPANHLNISLYRGKTMGIVGESGSGKSTTAYAIMRLLESTAECSGEILFEGKDLLKLKEKEIQDIRGKKIGMIFQEPMKCLDPSFRVEQLLLEALNAHEKIGRNEAKRKARDMLVRVDFPEPDTVLRSYPFELSGGMCQRVMIAMVLLSSPDIIIADEPTTALDVTIQEGIIGLLKEICHEDGRALFFVTHNFGLVAELCDDVCVMYGGSIVESGTTEDIFEHAVHPYTKGLLKAIPSAVYQGKQLLTPIEGKPIDLASMPVGCAFAPRCAGHTDRCEKEKPQLITVEGKHKTACFMCCTEEGADNV